MDTTRPSATPGGAEPEPPGMRPAGAARRGFALSEDWVATIVGLVLLALVLTGIIPVGLVP